jgi:hypothetical protein
VIDAERFLAGLEAQTPQPDPAIAAAEATAYALGLVAYQLGQVAEAVRSLGRTEAMGSLAISNAIDALANDLTERAAP